MKFLDRNLLKWFLTDDLVLESPNFSFSLSAMSAIATSASLSSLINSSCSGSQLVGASFVAEPLGRLAPAGDISPLRFLEGDGVSISGGVSRAVCLSR